MSPNVVVNRAELTRLHNCELQLTCLVSLGVDSWEGYEEAMEVYELEKVIRDE